MSAEIFGTVELVDQSIREPVALHKDGKVGVGVGPFRVWMTPANAERYIGRLVVAAKDAQTHLDTLQVMGIGRSA